MIYIGPLKPGCCAFFGEYSEAAATGRTSVATANGARL
jgi:hypothetical protein